MCDVLKKVRFFLASEDGPTATEYAVMLALIAGVAVAVVGSVGSTAENIFANIGAYLPS